MILVSYERIFVSSKINDQNYEKENCFSCNVGNDI